MPTRTQGLSWATQNRARPYSPYFDETRLNIIQEGLCLDVENVFTALDIKLSKYGKRFQGACPIHSGDCPTAIAFYPYGNSQPGYWKCFTKQCQSIFKPTVIGFIRGVLSAKNGWRLPNVGQATPPSKPESSMVSFRDTVDWCCKYLGVKLMDLKGDNAEIEKKKFAAMCGAMERKFTVEHKGITRAQIVDRLEIPSPYFIERGFSPEILTKYDVGFCHTANSPFLNKTVVPIYEGKGQFVMGYTVRSSHSECELCGVYHDKQFNCPALSERYLPKYAKWLNHGFERDGVLYNWHFAQKDIEKSHAVVLVEGPPDIWRLAEAGVNNAVAMLGWPLTDKQQILLETSGAMRVIIGTDMDDAGEKAAVEIRKQLERGYKVDRMSFAAKDLGDLPKEKVREICMTMKILSTN